MVTIAHKYHSGISFTNLATIRVLESEPVSRTNVHILNIPAQCQEIRIRTNNVFTDLTETYRQEFEPSNLFCEAQEVQSASAVFIRAYDIISAQNIPHLKI